MGPKICTGPQGLLCSVIKWSTKPEMLFYSSSFTICLQTIDHSTVYNNKYVFLLSFTNSDKCFLIYCRTTDHEEIRFCSGQVTWMEMGCPGSFPALALKLHRNSESLPSFFPLRILFPLTLMSPPLTTSKQTILLNKYSSYHLEEVTVWFRQ